MIGALDIMTVALLEKKFLHLSKRPDRLYFMMCGINRTQVLADYIGHDYIKDAVDFLQNVRPNIVPYYQMDIKNLPQIAIVSSGQESQQFIGEHGYNMKRDVKLPIQTIAEWTVESFNGDIMKVPASLELDKKLWPGLIITNGEQKFVLEGVVDASTLCLNGEVSSGTSLQGWKAVVNSADTYYRVNSSQDAVNIQCKLSTNGTAGNHRLFAMFLRYILKSSVLDFDRIGLQNLKISYSPMMVTSQDDNIFESVLELNGLYTDHWIEKEYSNIPDGVNTGLTVTTKAGKI